MPESRIFLAIAFPLVLRALPVSSRRIPAILMLFSLSDLGASASFLRTFITSIASRVGPIPLPTGWSPFVRITFTFMPSARPSFSNLDLRTFASFLFLILTCGPTGMSMRTWVEPTENFFAMIEARSIPCGSSERG